MTVAQTEVVESADNISPSGAEASTSFSRRLRRYRLGLGLFVCASLMLFASFFSAYLVRKGVANYEYAAQSYSTDWQSLKLPTLLLVVATGLLLLASITIEVARRKTLSAASHVTISANRRHAIWIWTSAVFTSGFLITVAAAWRALANQGHRIGSGAHASFFYVLTGTHSIHVAIGFMFLAYIALRPTWRTGDHSIATDLSAWYLHSMSALWLCILLLMSL